MSNASIAQHHLAEARKLVDAADSSEEARLAYERHFRAFEYHRDLDEHEQQCIEAREGSGINAMLGHGRDKPEARSYLPSLREYRAALAEGSNTTGGFLVPVQQANTFFDLLRAKSVVLAAGPRIVNMTNDVCRVPKILTSTTTDWFAENAALSSTEMTFEAVTLTAHKIAAYTLVSNELLSDSSPELRVVAGQDFAQAMAAGMDLGFLVGSTTPHPVGIKNFASVTETAAGADGSTPTADMLLHQISRLEVLNANIEKCAWFMHPRDWKSVKAFLTDEGDYLFNRDPVLSFRRTIFGIPVFLSTQLPITETVGGSGAVCSSIILADMDQIVVGMRQDITLMYSEHVAFDQDATAIRGVARADIMPINVAGVDILKGVLATT